MSSFANMLSVEADEKEPEKEKYDEKNEFFISATELNDRLNDLWENTERILYDSSEDIKEKGHQLGQLAHQTVNLLVLGSNSVKYRDISCEFCKSKNIFNKVYVWTGQHRECLKLMASEQLRYFHTVVAEAGISLLKCKEVVVPFLLLLLSLKPTEKRKIPPDIEAIYINILYHIAKRISNIEFLDLLSDDLHTDEGFRIPKYSFFELLILYTHRIGEIGDIARKAILSCVEASTKHEEFQNYISQESACVIIAGGLSARYSSLPTTLDIHVDDWYRITQADLKNMAELQEFLMTLQFCCEVSKNGGNEIQTRLSILIHDGFLKSVLAPALNQVSIDAQIAVMAYLDLFLRTITDERVMAVFLRVLLTEAYDNKPLINLLIYHVNSESIQLSMVAMQLFKTLLELNCEDVIFHLIFRYLLPCNHILPNQKRTIKEMDFYCKSATMFLYLTPECCLETSKNPVEFDEQGSPVSQRSIASKTVNESSSMSNSHLAPRKTSGTSIESSSSRASNNSELKPQEIVDFMAYLYDAKSLIRECKRSCKCWSAVYDGMDVVTDNPRLKSGSNRNSLSSPNYVQRNSLSFDSPEGFTFNRNSTTGSNDSDVIGGVDFPLPSIFTTECLGPFLNALFDKVEGMLSHNIYVNLLLTSVVTRLACYPQPLLRSFLLNANLVIRPGVRSLLQILLNLSNTVDGFVTQLDDYKLLITKAKQNLARREVRKFKRLSQEYPTPTLTNDGDENVADVGYSINLDAKKGAGKFQMQRKDTMEKSDKSIGVDDLVSLSPSHFGINTTPTKKGDLKKGSAFQHSGGKLHPAIPRRGRSRPLPSKKDLLDIRKKNPVVIKNAIYCAVILEELMKELAAVSIEQSLL